jgi:MOSC domain-containing protein YiiM
MSSIRNPRRHYSRSLIIIGTLFFQSAPGSYLCRPSSPTGTFSNSFPLIGVDALSTTAESYGKVVRLAARNYHPQHSKPSSREYTTRKDEQETLEIQTSGCVGDYNHYRTLALNSTPDRAVSLLTCDVLESLRTIYPDVSPGDLGENILIEGVSFRFFQVGQRYCIESSSMLDGDVLAMKDNDRDDPTNKPSSSSVFSGNGVVLEITERVQPCANLCKLPYINDETLTPKERIQRCQDFILHLDQWDGYRGWYAKVIQEGMVTQGAEVSKMIS